MVYTLRNSGRNHGGDDFLHLRRKFEWIRPEVSNSLSLSRKPTATGLKPMDTCSAVVPRNKEAIAQMFNRRRTRDATGLGCSLLVRQQLKCRELKLGPITCPVRNLNGHC